MREAERFDYDEVHDSSVFELFYLEAKNYGASLIVATNLFDLRLFPF